VPLLHCHVSTVPSLLTVWGVPRGPLCPVGCRPALSAHPWDGAVGTCRSLGPTAPGRAERGTSVLRTGLEVVPRQGQFYQLCLHPQHPGDPKPTAPCTELTQCVEMRGLSPRGYAGRDDISIPGSSRQPWLFQSCSGMKRGSRPGPVTAQGPEPFPQAAGHETRRAGLGSSAAPPGRPWGTGCGDSCCGPPESGSP